MPALVHLLQGSSVGLEKAIKRLRVYWGRKVLVDKGNGEIQSRNYTDSDYEQASGISKRQLEMKIHEIAKKVDRVWQVDKLVLEKYPTTHLQLNSNNIDLHSKITSPQNQYNCPFLIKPHLLKENLALYDNNKGATSDKQDECPRKRLKLTETQSSVVIA